MLADVLEVVQARDAQNGLGKLALLVWAEALRSPSIAGRFKTMLTQMRAAFAEIVRDHQSPGDVSADAMAAALFSVLPGYILQLALLGPEAVAGVPERRPGALAVMSRRRPRRDGRPTAPPADRSACGLEFLAADVGLAVGRQPGQRLVQGIK